MWKNYLIIMLFAGAFNVSSGYMTAEDPKVILCYGNSITAGYGLDPDYAYPAVLEKIIKEKGYNYKVVNAGLSGETSAGGLTRIDWTLRNQVDIFVLELGGNDGLRGLPLEQTRTNLESIINKVTRKYPEVQIVIAGMMVPPNMGPEYSKEFTYLFNNLATEKNAILIPFLLENVGGIAELNLPDGIHPNIEGHKIVAQNVYRSIKDILN